jgi:branched-subunit amino acid ABC-type transport system permease component
VLDLAQNTLDGLALGASYSLLALGFTLIFGVLRRMNLSYGPAVLFGCYCATWTHLNFQAGLIALALVTIAATVLAGAYVERLCFAPHRRGSAVAAMVASFALWMQIEEVAMLAMPRHIYPFPQLFEGAPLQFAGLSLPGDALVMLAATAAVCVLLHRLLYRSRFGLAVRAAIDNPLAASLAGIDLARTFVLVFALASAIGGLAGYLIVASHGQVTPMLGMWSTLKGLLAMMLGGLGSLPGAVLGGLALGLIEAHSQWFFGPQARDLVAYLLLFALLAARPAWMTRWTTIRSAS